MSSPHAEQGPEGRPGTPDEVEQVVVIGPDGQPVTVPAHVVRGIAVPGGDDEDGDERDPHDVTGLVEQPAKVMRIGRMVQQLLEEVKSAPLDEAGRTRLAGVVHTSIQELKDGLAPELDDELDRLIQPFDSGTPSESELRIAQAQLVGWLEGLFHGIQTAIYAQQMAARSQLEQMRRALPPGAVPGGPGPQGHPGHPGQAQDDDGQQHGSNGMYL